MVWKILAIWAACGSLGFTIFFSYAVFIDGLGHAARNWPVVLLVLFIFIVTGPFSWLLLSFVIGEDIRFKVISEARNIENERRGRR